MLTVLMECHDQESELAQTLSVLVAGAVEGLVSDVAVLDHGLPMRLRVLRMRLGASSIRSGI